MLFLTKPYFLLTFAHGFTYKALKQITLNYVDAYVGKLIKP